MAKMARKTSKKAANKKARLKKTASANRRARGAALIRIKRVYDAPESSDGLRILIDRLWPRGIAKAKLKLDAWVRPLAPSNTLRKWYQHDPAKFAAFRKRYRAELAQQRDGLAALRSATKGRRVTLLTSTRELDLSHATVLRALLR
jgi:uncharacterized protein YeaO (DUF488 family)